MKYIIYILYALLLLIMITLFYNKMLKEHFIESVTEICNARRKLELEPALNDIRGEPGAEGVVGRIGRQGVIGNIGETGISGKNGTDAKFIGTFNFRDNITSKIIDSVTKYEKNKDNVTTDIKLLRGPAGDNARMNPIIFKDSNTGKTIRKQFVENYDLEEIVVEIQNGDKGPSGKDAVCNTPGKVGNPGSQGPQGDPGKQGDPGHDTGQGVKGDLIEYPEFDTVYVDELCVNNLCIDLNMFRGIYEEANTLRDIANKEQEYIDEIERISNTATTEENVCPPKIQEQFADYLFNNSEYCTRSIQGDKGDTGKQGVDGYTSVSGGPGAQGLSGIPGINGDEIPNIEFIDKDKKILLGKFESFDKNAETKQIKLLNGEKGDDAYIPNIIFKYRNTEQARHDKIINKSNEDIPDIIVNLDNSQGPKGNNGNDGVCDIGDKGGDGNDGPTGPPGPDGKRGDDADPADKGVPGPIEKNPNYNKIIADKYCFANEIFSDICLNRELLTKLINTRVNVEEDSK